MRDTIQEICEVFYGSFLFVKLFFECVFYAFLLLVYIAMFLWLITNCGFFIGVGLAIGIFGSIGKQIAFR